MKFCKYRSRYWTPITGFGEYSCELPSVNDKMELCKFHDPLYWKTNPEEVEREFVSILQRYNQDPNVKHIVFMGIHLPRIRLSGINLKKPLIILNSSIHGDLYILHSSIPTLWVGGNTKIDGDLVIAGSNIDYLVFRDVWLDSLLIAGGSFSKSISLNRLFATHCVVIRNLDSKEIILINVVSIKVFLYDLKMEYLEILVAERYVDDKAMRSKVGTSKFFLTYISGLKELVIHGPISVRNISFVGTQLPKTTVFEGVIWQSSSKDRIITLDEVNLGNHDPRDIQKHCIEVEKKLGCTIKKEGGDKLVPCHDACFERYSIEYTLHSVLQVYRRIRSVLEENLLYDVASLCFISEMELKRNYQERIINGTQVLKKRNWFYRLFSPLGLYRLISLYGEDMSRALLSLVITIAGYSGGYMELNHTSFINALYLSTATIFQLKSSTPIELSEKIIGLILLANIAITLRRNLERKSKVV